MNEKLICISNELKKAFKTCTNNVRFIINNDVVSRNDVEKQLSSTPTIKSMFDIIRYVRKSDCYYYKLKTRNSRLYSFLDSFGDDNTRFANRINKLDKILKDSSISDLDIFETCDYGDDNCYRYYFLLNRGKNGNGDFVNDDMKEIIDIITKIRNCGVTDANPLDVSIDLLDDVSVWLITFGLKIE